MSFQTCLHREDFEFSLHLFVPPMGMTTLSVHVPCAADVVYDPDVAAGLVALLSKILRHSSPQVFVCSTIRNPETYGGFKKQLGEKKKKRPNSHCEL